MAKIIPVSTGEYKLPVYVSYTCAKCGREVDQQEDIYVSCTLTGIDFDTAKRILNSRLPDDTVSQIRHIADSGKKHGFLMPYDPMASGRRFHKAIQFCCPECSTIQLPDGGGKPFFRGRSRLLSFLTALIYVVIIGWFIGMGVVLFRSPVEPMNLLWVTLAAIAAGIGISLLQKGIIRRALRNPEVLYKQYGSVLNPGVYVDFTPYGLEKIRMNSQR